MGTSEKFCLKWNDFETNISIAFRDLRDNKDFFNVTLCCDDDSQVDAHKTILSACSPFFRSVLKRNPHQHPLLYLKGVKYKEMVAILDFMYMGEVNVAQDELNSFLAVAEDLRVKGLTQGNSESSNSKTKSESKSSRVRDPSSQDSSQPPTKKSRPSNAPSVNSQTPRQISKSPTIAKSPMPDDDDIQEVVPVKSEPNISNISGENSRGLPSSVDPSNDFDDSSMIDPNTVSLDDTYADDNYDYGTYEEGYDDNSTMMDPNTGMPLAAGADGNKGLIKSMVNEKMYREEGTKRWICKNCLYSSLRRSHVSEHVEIKHLENHPGCMCINCGETFTNTIKMRRHKCTHLIIHGQIPFVPIS